jgi:uncharacterized protein
MSAAQNKQTLTTILSALADGETRPFVEALADDIVWTVSGKTPWSKTYRGKAQLRSELFQPIMAKFALPYRVVTERLIAEEDVVVVQLRGNGNVTKQGTPYEQDYCWVCRLAEGKLKEVVEYADTDLAARVIGSPGSPS